MAENRTDYDLVIVGGGLVGASLAAALAPTALRIAIIEAFPFKEDAGEYQPAFDARSIALSYTSKQIFTGMGVWQDIDSLGVAAIEKIHVSDRGHAGITRLRAADEQVEALGYVAETRVVGRALFTRLKQQQNITLIAPASLRNFNLSSQRARIDIEQDGERKTLSAKLLVAADGGDSVVRRLSGVRIKQQSYDQYAVIANVAVDRPHYHQAFERFTDSGPLALLPMTPSGEQPHRYSLVWTADAATRDELLNEDDETFLARLQQRFGNRAGHFIAASQRYAYPLSLMRAQEHVRERLAIIGNAAHTLHPVAGQGFNLGLRDVAALSQVVVDALQQQQDIGSLEVLEHYAQWRKRDHIQTAMATDSLVRLFSSNFLPLAALRNLGLLLVDTLPPLKKMFARHAMGFVGRLPRLARGLKLQP